MAHKEQGSSSVNAKDDSLHIPIISCVSCNQYLTNMSVESRKCIMCDTEIPPEKLPDKFQTNQIKRQKTRMVKMRCDICQQELPENSKNSKICDLCKSSISLEKDKRCEYKNDSGGEYEFYFKEFETKISHESNDNKTDNQEYSASNSTVNTWKCLCTFINQLNMSNCEACISWRCTQCTLINEEFYQNCKACGENNSKKVPKEKPRENISQNTDDKWTCTKCTCRNNRVSKFCIACQSWRCSFCTGVNEMHFLTCDICNNKKEREVIDATNVLTVHDKTWKCRNCPRINEESTRKCTFCGSWRCKKCFYINDKCKTCDNCGYKEKTKNKIKIEIVERD